MINSLQSPLIQFFVSLIYPKLHDYVDWVITPEEETAGFPKRPVTKSGHEAELKKRTLTNLYNAKPAWLTNAHQTLDKAVAKAYGWDDYTPGMTDAEILQRLLKLNLAL